MPTFEDLPEEIIVYIFSYLHFPDRKNIRLVCKKWFSASYDVTLIKEDITILTKFPKLHSYANGNTKRFVNLRLQLVNCKDFSEKLQRKFWEQHGHDIKSVFISSRFYQHGTVRNILHFCPNLVEFTIKCFENQCCSNCICTEIPHLHWSCMVPKLETLNIINNRGMCPKSLQIMTAKMNSLKFASVTSPKQDVNFHEKILELLKRVGSTLQKLSVTTEFTSNNFQEIIDSIGSQLTALEFGLITSGLDDSSLILISNKLSNLEKLKVGGGLNKFLNLSTFLSSLTKLTHIDLRKISLSPSDIDALASLTELMCLDISYTGVTDEDMIKLFGLVTKTKMIELRLEGLLQISDFSVTTISQNLPNLQFLSLEECTQLTAASMDFICRHNHLLKSLSFPINHLKIETAVEMIKKLTNLIYLDLSKANDGVHYRHIDSYSELADLKKLELKELRILILGHVSFLNRQDLEPVFNSHPSLRYVMVLSGIHIFGHKRIKKFSCCGRYLPDKKIVIEWVMDGQANWCKIPSYARLGSDD